MNHTPKRKACVYERLVESCIHGCHRVIFLDGSLFEGGIVIHFFALCLGCSEPEDTGAKKAPTPIEVPVSIDKVVVIPYANVTSDSYLQCQPTITGVDVSSLNIGYLWTDLTTENVIGEDATLQLSADLVGPNSEVECRVLVSDVSGEEVEAAYSVLVERQIHHLENQEVWFTGFRPSDGLGTSISALGDITGDGLPEFMVSAPRNTSTAIEAGKSYLLTELSNSIQAAPIQFSGTGIKDHAGAAVGSAGDVDGDGFDEVLIGATGVDLGALNAGAAYLFYADTIWQGGEWSTDDADWLFLGTGTQEAYGQVVASAGDLEDDGYGDFAIAAPKSRGNGFESGRVDFYAGVALRAGNSAASFSLHGEQAYARLGTQVISAGDVDGDGLEDVWLGAPGSPSLLGKIYLMGGAEFTPDGVDLGDAQIVAEAAVLGDGTGSVLEVADFDGDGCPDIAIGTPYAEPNGYQSGGLAILHCAEFEEVVSLGDVAVQFRGEYADDLAGSAVAALQDMGSDAASEMVIGAPGNSEMASRSGKLTVHFSDDFSPGGVFELKDNTTNYLGEAAYDGAGSGLENLGDLNRDGLEELMVTAPGNNENGSDSGKVYIILGDDF